MKFDLCRDELWPWFALYESSSGNTELTDAEWRDYQEATERFCQWQRKLENIYPKDPPKKEYTDADYQAQALEHARSMYPEK